MCKKSNDTIQRHVLNCLEKITPPNCRIKNAEKNVGNSQKQHR